MLKALGSNTGNQTHKPRTHFMLTAGGRVVRVDHDPSVDNRLLMVPTEHELKTILYDQVIMCCDEDHTRQVSDFNFQYPKRAVVSVRIDTTST